MKIYILLLILFQMALLFGQNPRAFNSMGSSYGMDFSVYPPTVYSTGMNSKQCVASISDSNGNLLFYTNGGPDGTHQGIIGGIWNANHEMMENGEFDTTNGCYNSNNGAIIVPFPNSPQNSGKFYVFTKDCSLNAVSFNPTYSGITYAVVDMNFNGGLGKVVSKGNVLEQYMGNNGGIGAEAIRVTEHANGEDFWLFYNFNYQLHRTLITAEGIQPAEPLINIPFGRVFISPANDKMFIGKYLYDFNPATGECVLKDSLYPQLGDFSGDGRYFYRQIDDDIFQYDLESDNVEASETYIASSNVVINFYLAPNGVIYLLSRSTYLSSTYISGQIRCPNSQGISCDFSFNTIDLNGNTVGYNMSNMIASDLYYPYQNCTAGIDEKAEFSVFVFPNPVNDILSISAEKIIQQVELYSLDGKLLKLQKVNQFDFEVSLDDFPKGIYLVNIEVENHKIQRKIIKE